MFRSDCDVYGAWSKSFYLFLGDLEGLQIIADDTQFLFKLDNLAVKLISRLILKFVNRT